MADRRAHSRIQGLLDIGSGTVTAAVAVIEPSTEDGRLSPRIAGLGAHRSRGVKAGVLTDLDEAETVVRAAVAQAERAAGVTIDSVIASVACGRLSSRHFKANAETDTGLVGSGDLARVMAAGQAYAEREGRALVHMNKLGFLLDGCAGIRDPRGLAARQIAVQLHAVTMDEAPLRNLLLLIDRCHLACDGIVAAPYASGRAATTAEERDLGVVCINLGAGTTSLAIFADGRLVGVDVVPVGAQHITYDIAKSLQTPLVEAERIKTLYGTLLTAQSDDYETISYPLAGDDPSAIAHTTRARLTEIIRPRLAQIITLARERLAANEAGSLASGKFVLTGGASQLIGATEFFSEGLGRAGRLGKPGPMRGLTDAASTPQLSTLAGLAFAATGRDADFSSSLGASSSSRGYLGRVGSWLKAGF
ncbi:MAG: cell division protein FtsA [Hyphomicrobium sp.]